MSSLRSYYQLTKPGIIYANLMTAAAGYLLASRWDIDLALLAALLIGMALIIGSACVFNNYIDRGIDVKMERTKKRALVSGKVGARHALMYAVMLAILGFAILARTNWLTFTIGVSAFLSYVVLYGVAKRKTIHGTLVGTLPGAASLVAGYTAVLNRLDQTAFILLLIMVAWQMAHFYSIAIYRFKDYQAAGLPVWPVKKGIQNTKLQIMAYILAFIVTALALGIFGEAGIIYSIIIGIVSLYWFYKGLQGFRAKKDDEWARGMFGFSLVVLLVFSTMIALSSQLP